MTGTARFTCSDPDAGDFEFADVDAVLDGLEAGLITAATPMFDLARQSMQPVGAHPEVRSAWEDRLQYRPPGASGLALPALPSLTALARSLPADAADPTDGERRRDAFARVRHPPVEVRTLGEGDAPPRFAAFGMVWAVVLLALVGWVIVMFAAQLTELAARAMNVRPGH